MRCLSCTDVVAAPLVKFLPHLANRMCSLAKLPLLRHCRTNNVEPKLFNRNILPISNQSKRVAHVSRTNFTPALNGGTELGCDKILCTRVPNFGRVRHFLSNGSFIRYPLGAAAAFSVNGAIRLKLHVTFRVVRPAQTCIRVINVRTLHFFYRLNH